MGRYEHYSAALKRDVDQYGLSPLDYVGDDNPMFDTLAIHMGTFNRMII